MTGQQHKSKLAFLGVIMARQIRNIGQSGWAHIILRGINRENLFYDKEDFTRFISVMDRFQRECSFILEAYCLMSNHVHMLLYSEDRQHAEIIKKIAVSYAAYYNKKYDRVGHVFQDRFRSEPVNDERYLLIVARYIYLNPQKACICRAAEYPYSMVRTDGILSGFFTSEDELMDFLETENGDCCLEYDSINGFTDSEALAVLNSLIGNQNPQSVQALDRKQRDEILLQLKQNGLTIRQISRITGINRNIVQRA